METMAHVRIQGSCDRRRIGRSIQYHICLPLIVSSGASSQSVVRIYSLATADAHAMLMWHHKSVIALFHIVLRLLIDLIALTALGLRQRRATAAEILVLRRQIALYQERGIKPRRIDPVTRISLALLSRFFNWRDVLVVVRPETMRRWHRAGWKLFWRLKSRPGRPRIPEQIQALIHRIRRRQRIITSIADPDIACARMLPCARTPCWVVSTMSISWHQPSRRSVFADDRCLFYRSAKVTSLSQLYGCSR